jgi:class 3 adenylate cyclase
MQVRLRTVYFQVAVIVGLVGVVTLLHYETVQGRLGPHILHRELYFFPILMAGFWFGLRIGLTTSLIVSGIYAAHVWVFNDPPTEQLMVVSQVVIFNLVAVLIGGMVDRRNRRIAELNFIRDTFGRYVSNEVRDEILSQRIPLDGEVKEVTVLFADLRNFAQLVDTTAPKEVVRILNEYFKEMSQAIEMYDGLVLQFIGDEIEAVFGAPLPLENHRRCAVNAALEMRRRVSRVNLKLINQGYSPLQHGIGIHCGSVLAANIGSPERLSYAMVGDTVNIASRLQELNKQYGSDVLISGAVLEGGAGAVPAEKLDSVYIKGIAAAVDLYKLA